MYGSLSILVAMNMGAYQKRKKVGNSSAGLVGGPVNIRPKENPDTCNLVAMNMGAYQTRKKVGNSSAGLVGGSRIYAIKTEFRDLQFGRKQHGSLPNEKESRKFVGRFWGRVSVTCYQNRIPPVYNPS